MDVTKNNESVCPKFYFFSLDFDTFLKDLNFFQFSGTQIFRKHYLRS